MQDDSQRRDEGRNTQSGAGQTRGDEEVRASVFDALSLHGIDLRDISIGVENGRVSLDGSISDQQMKERIEEIISECDGVQHVNNNLGIAKAAGGGRDTAGNQRPGTDG